MLVPILQVEKSSEELRLGYIGLIMTLLVIGYVLFFDANIYLHVLIFFTSMSMVLPFFEVKSGNMYCKRFPRFKKYGTKISERT